ncbi:MAG TPA: F0F1 ATP synthase subunit A [Anaeromyxobacteraceae bacterium]|nr:F0F1 ATP synthase subunit A [Anaeromyxobacteraceae bacterium]
MIAHAALLALGLTLGQHEAAGTVREQNPQAKVEAPEHGEKGEAGEKAEKQDLPTLMLEHVANGDTIEYPGFCHGRLAWNCELNLRALTGGRWVIHAGGTQFDMNPSKHTIMMWFASIVLLVVFGVGARKRAVVPHGLYNFLELLVQFVRDIAISNMGKRHADRFVPYLCSAFFFILFMNLLGLLPFTLFSVATGNISVTVALAGFTFIITQYAAIKEQGIGGYFAHLTGGVPKSLWWIWPIMIPVEVMGLFTKPFALTVRLFANMVAGHFVILSLLGLIFAISFWVFPVSVAIAMAMFMLEIFVAFVQAYIFTMLSALFIGLGLAHGHDEEEHSEQSGGEHGVGEDSYVGRKVPSHG